MDKKIDYPKTPEGLQRIDQFLSFKENWRFSLKTLEELNSRLNESFNEDDFAVCVAGSFGRLDASKESDLDYIVLTNNKLSKDDEIHKRIRRIATNLNIRLPNPEGVFSETTCMKDLIDKIGGRDDDLFILAQRMLLLMETKPIYNERLFKNMVNKLLTRYLEYVLADPFKEALFLLNDLIRYFRSIAVNYQFNFWKEEQKWVIRNVKLRHSRILMYSGLLFLILNASKNKNDKYQYIESKIYLTPIEKLIHVYLDNKDYGFMKLIGMYDIFLRSINDREIRKKLQIDYEDRFKNPYYSHLKVTSDSFMAELSRFIFAHRSSWTQEVIQYLIF